MGKQNPYKKKINTDGFVERLTQGDNTAWETLRLCVRQAVAREVKRRPLPPGFVESDAIDEYTSRVTGSVLTNLEKFRGDGFFSNYVDRLVRTVMWDDYKDLMNAVTRFLRAAYRFPPGGRRTLRAIILEKPPPEQEILLTSMEGQKTNLSTPQRRYRWSTARYALLFDIDHKFEKLLYTLAKARVRQAKTLLVHLAVFRGAQPYPESEEDDGTTLPIEALPSIEMEESPRDPAIIFEQRAHEEQEWRQQQLLLECLEVLRQENAAQYQVIIRRYGKGESNAQIADALDVSNPAVRQRHSRGLKDLRDCLSRKPFEYRGER